MLELLSSAKNWFMDATFKIVKHPFIKVLSIHGFIQCGKSTNRSPCSLLSCLEGLRKIKVLKAIVNLTELTIYLSTIWLNNNLWPVSTWSVFCCFIRNNNDVEGWYHCMNEKAKRGQVSFYLLLQLLHDEAVQVNVRA